MIFTPLCLRWYWPRFSVTPVPLRLWLRSSRWAPVPWNSASSWRKPNHLGTRHECKSCEKNCESSSPVFMLLTFFFCPTGVCTTQTSCSVWVSAMRVYPTYWSWSSANWWESWWYTVAVKRLDTSSHSIYSVHCTHLQADLASTILLLKASWDCLEWVGPHCEVKQPTSAQHVCKRLQDCRTNHFRWILR